MLPLRLVIFALCLTPSALLAQDDWFKTAPPAPAPPSAPPAENPVQPTTAPASNPLSAPAAAPILASLKQREQFFKIAPAFSRAFIRWGDDYAVLPDYNPAFPNNVGYTVDQAQFALGKPGTIIDGAVVKKVTFVYPKAETQAIVMPIRSMTPGQYGYINSLTVDKILSPDEMLVSDLWIIDPLAMSKEMETLWAVMERKARAIGETNERLKQATAERNAAILSTIIVNPDGTVVQPQIDRAHTDSVNALPTTQQLLTQARQELDDMYFFRVRVARSQQAGRYKGPYRLKGYLTAGIIEGKRWHGSNAVGPVGQGFQIAVIRPYGPNASTQPADNPQTPLQVIPADAFKKPLNPEQFAVMLAKYGMTADQFVDMAVAHMRANPKTARENIFISLEKLRENWESKLNAAVESPTPPPPPLPPFALPPSR